MLDLKSPKFIKAPLRHVSMMAAKTALGNGSNAWLIVTDATMRTRAETRPVSG